jgi:chemosensory pili system protein ChpA (sensor histidine kinase/response regulator)
LLPDRIEYINNLPMRQVHADMSFGVGVLGQVLLSDGRVAVVINPDQLLQSYAAFQTEILSIAEPTPAREFPLVLVVDDSITVRKVTTRLLSKLGMRVETAENGAIALEKVSNLHPDIVLMDIEMPVMDGFDATRAIRSMPDFVGLPIAIISSRNAEKHREFAQSIGATQFFGKPYNEDELIEWINSEFAKAKEKGVAQKVDVPVRPATWNSSLDFGSTSPAPLF